MSAVNPPAPTPTPPQSAAEATGRPDARPSILRRIVQGDLAAARVVLGLIVIGIVFQLQNDRFLSAVNLTNLLLQITATGLISVGIVYVLLLGEIDLSVGAVSGVTSALLAVMNVKHGWNPYLAIVAAIAMGAAIGVLQGSLFTTFGIPSFVITLAGLLAWQGLQLYILGDTGTVNITDSVLVWPANTFIASIFWQWAIGVGVIVVYAGLALLGYRRRVATGLTGQDLVPVLARIGVLAAAVVIGILVVSADRGIPVAVLILLGFVAGMDLLATRTSFGRHVYAVGGNAEAARRAGISVHRVRIACFAICSSMAAVGGIMAASRLLAVNQSSGGSDLLLLAIAGPVIAGTSLFGGRGSVWSALLGALVIGSISNGMDLLALDSSVKYMVTGAVLLAAVVVDAIARRQRQAEGRL
jgi:D-xylose transport system permease protein